MARGDGVGGGGPCSARIRNPASTGERMKLPLNLSCMTGFNLVTLAPAFGFLTKLVQPSILREPRHPESVSRPDGLHPAG